MAGREKITHIEHRKVLDVVTEKYGSVTAETVVMAARNAAELFDAELAAKARGHFEWDDSQGGRKASAKASAQLHRGIRRAAREGGAAQENHHDGAGIGGGAGERARAQVRSEHVGRRSPAVAGGFAVIVVRAGPVVESLPGGAA